MRHGTENGSVTLGGRRVPVERPRMRAVDGSGRAAGAVLRAVHQHRGAGPDGDAKMLAGLSTRRYPVGLEPVGEQVERAATRDEQVRGLAPVRRRDRDRAGRAARRDLLGELDLVALMIDGVHFGEHLCVVALGIGIDGTKHPLGAGRGRHREHHRGHRSADRAA